MKTTARVLLCLLGVVVLVKGQTTPGSRGNGVDACFQAHDNWDRCPDYKKLIPCLQKLLPLKPGKYDDDEGLKHEISRLTREMNECPGFSDKGKCLSVELNKCTDNLVLATNESERCNQVSVSVKCMEALKSLCPLDRLDEELDYYTNQRDYCTAGATEEYCLDEVNACMDVFSTVGEDLTASCAKTKTVRPCMAKVLSNGTCNIDLVKKKIERQRRYLASIDEHCAFELGACGRKKVGSCTIIVYGDSIQDDDPSQGDASMGDDDAMQDDTSKRTTPGGPVDSCSPKNLAAALKCLEAVKPRCVKDAEIDMFHEEKKYMLDFCRYRPN